MRAAKQQIFVPPHNNACGNCLSATPDDYKIHLWTSPAGANKSSAQSLDVMINALQ
jgi:hypothetical protein